MPVNPNDLFSMNEDTRLRVTDETVLGMMRFITDKYNSLRFDEIEKSAGDIDKFKYLKVLRENLKTLRNIYESSSDEGAKNYIQVINDVGAVLDHLEAHRVEYSELYKSGNGVVQLLYTSLVAGCVYSIGIMVSNTIRFVTTETETDCQVLFDEIPGTLKHVHIRNIRSAAADLDNISKILASMYSKKGSKALRESVSIAAVAGVIAGIVVGLPLLLTLIREIIYSIYFTRVKLADMLAMQMDLINTNIESLESRGGPKKVIARQRKWVDRLSWWQKRLAVNMDTTGALVSSQKTRENVKLKVDKSSPIAQDPGYYSSGELMI